MRFAFATRVPSNDPYPSSSSRWLVTRVQDGLLAHRALSCGKADGGAPLK